MPIDAIFLDVGGIILRIDWTPTFHALNIFEKSRQNALLEKVRDWNQLHNFETGKLSSSSFFQLFRTHTEVDQEEEILTNAWNQLIIGPLAEADRIFDTFSGKVPIYALSNTNQVHHEYQLRQFPILKRFDHFFTSHELGDRKPGQEIFKKALKITGHSAQRSVFVDDSLANVMTAKGLGFHAYQTVNAPLETLKHLQSHF